MPNTSKLEESEEEKLKSMPLSRLILDLIFLETDRSSRGYDELYVKQVSKEIDRREILYLGDSDRLYQKLRLSR